VPIRHLLLASALVLLSSCATTSTQLTSTWVEPGAGPLKYKKILATVMSDQRGARMSAELRLSQRIPNTVAAFTVFDDGDEKNQERVKARIRELGFDAVVMLRVVSVDRDTVYVPPSVTTVAGTYGGMYGYWGTGWSTVYDPGYTSESTMAIVETSIFEVAGEKLVWISGSRTMDPGDVNEAVDEIIDANAKAMREQGLIAPKG